jgi:hypothetical protein
MRKEKMIADQLQCMFLEGKLNGFKEAYINLITKKLRTGVKKTAKIAVHKRFT